LTAHRYAPSAPGGLKTVKNNMKPIKNTLINQRLKQDTSTQAIFFNIKIAQLPSCSPSYKTIQHKHWKHI
jgi:hypothetical protein